MFEFLKRRHAAPAEAPLAEARFSSEDLFVLLGGGDSGQFAVDEYAVDFDRWAREGAAAWRRAMAARLAPTGLVDASGEPCGELAEALWPLNKPGVTVEDGSPRLSARERDGRAVSAVFYQGRATALRRAPGRRGGFTVHPLGGPDGWDARFRGLSFISPVGPAPIPERIVCKTDPAIGEAIVRNDAAWLDAFCARHGSDGRALRDFAARLAGDRRLRGEHRRLVSVDLRASVFDESLGFTVPVPNGDLCRSKCVRCFPPVGAFITCAFAVKTPGDEEMAEFGVIDFVAGGTLLDYMFDFYDYPDELR